MIVIWLSINSSNDQVLATVFCRDNIWDGDDLTQIPLCYGSRVLAVSRKPRVIEQNGIKILTLWVQRGTEESFGGVPGKKDKVWGKVKKREVSHGD